MYPLLKDIEAENKLAVETNDFIKSMKHTVSKSCFTCQYLRKYRTNLGGYSLDEFGCEIIYDKSNGQIVTKPNYLSCCGMYKKMQKYRNKRDLRCGSGFPVVREPEVIRLSDELDAEVITFKGNIDAAYSVNTFHFAGDDVPIVVTDIVKKEN